MQDDLFTYNGTTGFVNQPASRDRAQREATDGTARERINMILAHLATTPDGMTWKQLGDLLGYHHGQISGALSNLHKTGAVFMLRNKRNNCHPYVHNFWRNRYDETERIDEPVKTKTKQRTQELEDLLMLVVEAIKNNDIKNHAVITYALQLHHDHQ